MRHVLIRRCSKGICKVYSLEALQGAQRNYCARAVRAGWQEMTSEAFKIKKSVCLYVDRKHPRDYPRRLITKSVLMNFSPTYNLRWDNAIFLVLVVLRCRALSSLD